MEVCSRNPSDILESKRWLLFGRVVSQDPCSYENFRCFGAYDRLVHLSLFYDLRSEHTVRCENSVRKRLRALTVTALILLTAKQTDNFRLV